MFIEIELYKFIKLELCLVVFSFLLFFYVMWGEKIGESNCEYVWICLVKNVCLSVYVWVW